MSVTPITHPLLAPIAHGFFTRKGGVSKGIYDGLNCGGASKDDPQNVEQNRALVAQTLGLKHGLAFVHQTHSADVQVATHENINEKPEADAIVTNQPGIGLAILTADCEPVLFADPTAHVIGAAHAGWRGAIDGILENTIDAMCRIGAKRENIRAIIGPTIGPKAYEVGPEFLSRFLEYDKNSARFFTQGAGDRHHFDLPSFGLSRLTNAGIKQAHWTGDCTYSDAERFFSYRRSVHHKDDDYGRLISVIALP